LDKLVNTKELAENLDATNRIKLTNSSELAGLEHKVIHQLLTNYDEKGPESMQGWLDSDWWLTGLPQQYVRFRESNQDMTVFLTADNVFLEKGQRGKTVAVGKNNVTFDVLSQSQEPNLWFKRNYSSLLEEKAKELGSNDRDAIALIYGEINIPLYGEPLTTQQFNYNEQLGLFKK